MPATLARPLSAVCAVCSSPLTYSGRGRKPEVCPDAACKREAARRRKAAQRAELAATGRTMTQRRRDEAISAIDARQLDGAAHRAIISDGPLSSHGSNYSDPDLIGSGYRVEMAPSEPAIIDPDGRTVAPAVQRAKPDAWRTFDGSYDPAAEWLAAEHPELLDDWQTNYRQGQHRPVSH